MKSKKEVERERILQRYVVHERRFHLPTSWRTSTDASRRRWCSIPDSQWDASTWWDILKDTLTMSQKVRSTICGPKRRVSISLRCGQGRQDSRSCVQDFLKDTSGKVVNPQRAKTTTRPDNILPEAWTQLSQETKRKTKLQDVQKKVQNCTQRGATRESTRSRLVTRISSRWQLKLVWNLKRITLLRCVALSGMTVDRSHGCVLLCGTLADNERAYDRKRLDPTSEKAYVWSFQYDLLHKPITIQEAIRIPDATTAVNKGWAKLKWLPAGGWDDKNV